MTISSFIRKHAGLLVLILLSHSAVSETTVTFAGDPWPPFFLSSSGIYLDGGVGVEVTRAVFSRIEGVSPVFPVIPWRRALLEAQYGIKDGITFLMKTSQREKFLLFSIPVAQAPACFFFSRKRFPEGFLWESAEDLRELRIGIVSGYTYGAYLDGLISSKHLKFIEINSSTLGFLMLQKERIDLMAETTPVGITILREQGWLDNAGWTEKIINTDIYYIALSKKSPAKRFLKQINSAILATSSDGTIDALLSKVGATGFNHAFQQD